MLILKYLKPKNSLPDPNDPLSSHLPLQAFAPANSHVTKGTNNTKENVANTKSPLKHWLNPQIQQVLNSSILLCLDLQLVEGYFGNFPHCMSVCTKKILTQKINTRVNGKHSQTTVAT